MDKFEARNPAFAERVRDSFERQGAMALLGAELTRVEPGICEIRLDYRPEVSQQHGYIHGGIVGTIADSAGGYAAFTLMAADTSVLTVEYKLNLLASADGDWIIARARVVKPGRSLVVSAIDVVVNKRGRETLCATSLQTLMTMHGRPDR